MQQLYPYFLSITPSGVCCRKYEQKYNEVSNLSILILFFFLNPGGGDPGYDHNGTFYCHIFISTVS